MTNIAIQVPPLPDPLLVATDIERAYAAGFFDGEGTITIAQNNANAAGPLYNMRVIVGQNDIGPLLWLRERWGGTIVAKAAFSTRKQHHTWSCFSRQAERFLRHVLPFLQHKRERAEVALRFQAGVPRTGTSRSSEARRSFYADCRAEMLRLNGYKRT